jgi:hypothetical protein
MSSTRLHPLHTPTWVAQYVVNNGEYPGDRATGRSTAAALTCIAEAMRRPGVNLPVYDHHGTTLANAHLRQLTESAVEALGLEHFHFGRSHINSVHWTIRFGDEA